MRCAAGDVASATARSCASDDARIASAAAAFNSAACLSSVRRTSYRSSRGWKEKTETAASADAAAIGRTRRGGHAAVALLAETSRDAVEPWSSIRASVFHGLDDADRPDKEPAADSSKMRGHRDCPRHLETPQPCGDCGPRALPPHHYSCPPARP